MTFEQIFKEIQSKKYKPIYFLSGEETYFIDKISDFIEKNVLPEDQKAFNQTILYGKDIAAAQIDNAARRFPMMSDYQVIVVKEAQEVKDIENLVFYAQKPSKSTILVICYKYKTLDKRKKLYKTIEENGILLETKKLYENQVPSWIEKYVLEHQYEIDMVASSLLTDFLGNNLSKIANELDKLFISLPQKTKITIEHIEKNVGISKEYNNFELQNALMRKDHLKAQRIVNYFADNQRDNPIVVTITSLYFYFSKVLAYHYVDDKKTVASVLQVNPYFLRDYEETSKKYSKAKLVEIIALLREFDMKSKGFGNVSANAGELLKELVFKILH